MNQDAEVKVFFESNKVDKNTKNSIQEIARWHAETFPEETLEGQSDKFLEERAEWEESHDLLELADCWIVACGLTRFRSVNSARCFWYVIEQCMLYAIKFKDLLKAVDKKMEINYNRTWTRLKAGAYHHV